MQIYQQPFQSGSPKKILLSTYHSMRNLVSNIHWKCHIGNFTSLFHSNIRFLVFDRHYFCTAYIFHRSLHKRQPIEDPKFQVPVYVVMGEKDYVFKFPGIESVLKDGIMEKFAPDLKITFVAEGSHFVQEQFPDKVNDLLLSFLRDHIVPA